MSGIPKQVKEQGEKADKLHKDLYPDEPEAGVEAEPEKVVEPEKKEPEVTGQAEIEKLQHKFSVLQGKYDAEVRDAQSGNQHLVTEILKLKQEIESLKAKPAEPVVPEKVDVSSYFTPDEMEILEQEGISQDVSSLIMSAAKKLAADQFGPVAENLSRDVGELKTSNVRTAEEKYWAHINAQVPDWKETNANPEFRRYLGERVPGTSFNRQVLLNDAEKKLDAVRLVEIFKGFKGRTSAPPPKDPPAKPKLEADPVSIQPSGAMVVPEGKVYSRQEVTAFFTAVTKGDYKHDPAKAKAMEADILRASTEGRIR